MSIMRPNPLGNPFIIGVHGRRQTVLELFEEYARKSHLMQGMIANLNDVDLMCCCTPMPCHGDIILKIWDEMHGRGQEVASA